MTRRNRVILVAALAAGAAAYGLLRVLWLGADRIVEDAPCAELLRDADVEALADREGPVWEVRRTQGRCEATKGDQARVVMDRAADPVQVVNDRARTLPRRRGFIGAETVPFLGETAHVAELARLDGGARRVTRLLLFARSGVALELSVTFAEAEGGAKTPAQQVFLSRLRDRFSQDRALERQIARFLR